MNAETIMMLYRYNDWAHQRVWDCIMQISKEQFTRPLDYSIGSLHAQVVHTMSAEWIWFSRLNGTTPEAMLAPEDYPTRPDIRAKWDAIRAANWRTLEAQTDATLAETYTYTTTSGATHRQTVAEILLHVINHGTDHRAQILAMLDKVGGPTVAQDLIFFLRERTP